MTPRWPPETRGAVPLLQMAFTLRRVGEPELAELVALYEQCAEFIRLGSAAPIDAGMVRADLALSVHEGGAFHGIYLPDGALAGVVDYAAGGYMGQADAAFIILLMIGAPWRGRGLGAGVVSLVERQVWANLAVDVLHTAVQVNNPPAIAFWQAVGYRRVSGPTLQPDGTTTYLLEKKRPVAQR